MKFWSAGRLRIAHVPYATSLALAKKKVSETMNKNLELKTVAQTAKGGSRVAHIPVAVSFVMKLYLKKLISKL